MSYLLDTNVLSELVKSRKNAGVLDWLAATSSRDHYVSVMTFGEIRRGISLLQLRNDTEQADRLAGWLAATIRDFAGRVVPITADAAERWGHHHAGRPLPIVDGLIGATAAVHGWTLVTRNTKDFEHLDVALLNPFTL